MVKVKTPRSQLSDLLWRLGNDRRLSREEAKLLRMVSFELMKTSRVECPVCFLRRMLEVDNGRKLTVADHDRVQG